MKTNEKSDVNTEMNKERLNKKEENKRQIKQKFRRNGE